MTYIAVGVICSIVGTIFPEAMRGLKEVSFAVFGVMLMLIIMFFPNGLVSMYAPISRLLRRIILREGATSTPTQEHQP
jgi:sulfite exporter TauE/SafE